MTLSSTNWANNQQVVYCYGVTTSNIVMVSPDVSGMDAWVDFGIKCIGQTTNYLTFSCESVPDVNINVTAVVLP